jgi:hypothetical protein
MDSKIGFNKTQVCLPKSDENRLKSAKIGENRRKSAKIGENRRKSAKIGKNWQKSPKMVIVTLAPAHTVTNQRLRLSGTSPHLYLHTWGGRKELV